MAIKTGLAVVGISRHSIVVISYFHGIVMLMAIYTAEQCEIAGNGMTFDALIPCTFVISTENGEVLTVVVPGRWRPCVLSMAAFAVGRELGRLVIRIVRIVVLALVATETGSRGVDVIPVVAGIAVVGDSCMGARQHIVIVVYGE